MTKYAVLGKSHFALAVIFDILSLKHPDGCEVVVVRNIPDSQNSSAAYSYAHDSIASTEVDQIEWVREAGVPLIMGSIGKSRRAIYSSFQASHGVKEIDFISLTHPSAVVPETAIIHPGAHIGPGVTVAPFARIGAFAVVNRSATIGHHTVLEDFACVNPGATVAGICLLGKSVTVGAGATIIDGIAIGDNTVVGAGSLVTRDIEASIVCYGSPAKKVRDL